VSWVWVRRLGVRRSCRLTHGRPSEVEGPTRTNGGAQCVPFVLDHGEASLTQCSLRHFRILRHALAVPSLLGPGCGDKGDDSNPGEADADTDSDTDADADTDTDTEAGCNQPVADNPDCLDEVITEVTRFEAIPVEDWQCKKDGGSESTDHSCDDELATVMACFGG
jgi:hypothetical protein